MSFLGNGVGRQLIMPGQIAPAAVGYSNLDSTVTTPLSGYKNRLINGNFDFWQRGTSLAASSSGAGRYLADRWTSSASGTSIAPSQQAFTLGQTAVPNEPTYFHRCVVVSSAGAANNATLAQPIEGVRTFAGQSAVLSFWAKADASKNMAVEFIQGFGTGGSPSATINSLGVTTIALTTNWQQFKVQVSVPSILGKTLGSNGDDQLVVAFWFDAGSNFNSRSNSLGQQSGTFDIAKVQFEAGSTATQFEYRPYPIELTLCQRYYEAGDVAPWYESGFSGYAVAMMFPFTYKVTKRVAPTVAFSNVYYYSAGTPTAIASGYSQVGGGLYSSSLYISSGTTNMNGLSNASFTASSEL